MELRAAVKIQVRDMLAWTNTVTMAIDLFIYLEGLKECK